MRAQFVLYNVCPNDAYVADPYTGYSNHSRGNTVDLTVWYIDGGLFTVPMWFDDFSLKVDRDYNDCTDEGITGNIVVGFVPYSRE